MEDTKFPPRIWTWEYRDKKGRVLEDGFGVHPMPDHIPYISIAEHEHLLREAIFKAHDAISLMVSLIENGENSAARMAGMDALVGYAKAAQLGDGGRGRE